MINLKKVNFFCYLDTLKDKGKMTETKSDAENNKEKGYNSIKKDNSQLKDKKKDINKNTTK